MNKSVSHAMVRTLTVLATTILTSGCVQSISISEQVDDTPKIVSARSVIVNDLTRAPKVSSQDGVWSRDFHPLSDDSVRPSFRRLAVSRTKTGIKANGKGRSDLVISMVDAVILQKARIADSVAFVGIASALSPREFRCLVDVNLQYGTTSIRRTFDHSAELPRSWVDTKIKDRQAFVKRCLSVITDKMNAYIGILPEQN